MKHGTTAASECIAIRFSGSSDDGQARKQPTECLQVIVSSAAFAGSHLSVQGFPQLFAFGCILGTAHVASQRNLLLPTLMHSSFNLFILAALLITSFPLGIAQGSP